MRPRIGGMAHHSNGCGSGHGHRRTGAVAACYDGAMSSIPARFSALAVAAALVAVPATASAGGLGIGLFIGQPTGLTIKVDLQRRTALDIVLGVTDFDDDRGRSNYGHVTYQVTPFAATGESVVVPFRIGIGVAAYDGAGDFGDEVNVAVRAPIGIALQLRRTPVEFYGEVAFKLVLLDENDNEDLVNLDGGIGFRIYF